MFFDTYKHLIILLLLFFYSINIYAENKNLHFSHLTTDDGLSRSNVTCILQDHKDYMWFGTSNGLNRYDGYKFKVYQYNPDDSLTISHNYISYIYEDHQGSLWVGTSDGLNCYKRSLDSFIYYKHDENNSTTISGNQIETIYEDSKNRLWIGTRNGGLNVFDRKNNSFIHYSSSKQNKYHLSSDFIRKLYETSSGLLWVAHWNGMIDIFDEENNTFKNLLNDGKQLTHSRTTALIESPDKNIWLGTQGDGLFCIKSDNDQILDVIHYKHQQGNNNSISSNIVLSLMIDQQGNLWIGTEDEGLDILDIRSGTFSNYKPDPFDEASLNHNSIWSIYEDKTNNIWLGTFAGGINLLTNRETRFRHYKPIPGNKNSLNNNIVNSFWEDENQKIWIATDGGGLNLFDMKNGTFTVLNSSNSALKSDVIIYIIENKQDFLWIGTWADGLYGFNRKTKKFVHYTKENNGLGSNNILHMLEDKKGGLWLCTFWGGLTYFDPDNKSVVVYNSENSNLSDNDVRVIEKDKQSNFWIGTDVGLDYFDSKTKTFKNYKHDGQDKNSLSKGFVQALLIARDSTLWIGTTGGLNKFDRWTKKFKKYTQQDGLPDNEIKCIIEDDNNILWITTNKGLSRFDPNTEEFKNYDASDGLIGNEFNTLSGYKMNSGEILFGGNNGFIIFDPKNIVDNNIIPPVVITGFNLFNKPVPVGRKGSPLKKHISETDELILSYEHSVFSFEFVALNYISPEKNKYAYIMEGFEKNWNYVGSTRTATYTNLDAGNYIFKVKASNNDGIWNEQGTSIKITIEPPFWKTWWFYLIEILLLFGIVSFVLNHFINRQRLRNALKLEHLELEKMYEIDQMKTELFTNISHEFHSPMTLILGPLEKLISSPDVDKKSKNSLELIQYNAKRLQRMTNQLKDFHKLETGDLQLKLLKGEIIQFIREIVNSFQDYARAHEIQFHFFTGEESVIAWFDPDKLDKIIYNLLSNAFKFTPDNGEISVSASIISPDRFIKSMNNKEMANQYIEIIVQDSGIGIPEDKIKHIFKRFYHREDYNGRHFEGMGVGLAFVYQLLKLYHGEIDVESEEGHGSKFIVQIPIDEHYLDDKQLVAEFNIDHLDNFSNNGMLSLSVPSIYMKEKDKNKLSKDIPVVLIVDDDKEIREYIKNEMHTKFRIFEAENGIEGLKKAFKIIPDLIISDIKMPEIDGTQLCDQLKEDEKTSHIPIILLTSYTSEEHKIKGLSRGADVYLTKPFNVDVLEAQSINLLESRKKLRKKFSQQLVLGPKEIMLTDIDKNFLDRIIETIENYISDPDFNADVLSKKMAMSRMQLYRKLRSLTDQTVHEFIRKIRLKRAVQLLATKRTTITEVAYEVGFNDLTYFARCFRKQYNKSPSEYVSGK